MKIAVLIDDILPGPEDAADIGEGAREAAAAEPPAPAGARFEARGLGLRTRRGWTFRNVSLDVPPGAVATIVGPARSGRSTLLLSLAGHMRPTEGRAFVDGIDVSSDPAAARSAVGLGLFEGLNDLEDDLSVADHLRQELSLHPEIPRGSDWAGALARVGLEIDDRTPVEDLAPLQRVLLGVALALVGSPRAVVLDDVDRDLGAPERRILWSILKRIASDGTTVLAACIDHEAAHAADIVFDLETISSREG